MVCGFVGPLCDKGNIRIRKGALMKQDTTQMEGQEAGEKETDLGRRLLANMALTPLSMQSLAGSSSQCQAGLEVAAFI